MGSTSEDEVKNTSGSNQNQNKVLNLPIAWKKTNWRKTFFSFSQMKIKAKKSFAKDESHAWKEEKAYLKGEEMMQKEKPY